MNPPQEKFKFAAVYPQLQLFFYIDCVLQVGKTWWIKYTVIIQSPNISNCVNILSTIAVIYWFDTFFTSSYIDMDVVLSERGQTKFDWREQIWFQSPFDVDIHQNIEKVRKSPRCGVCGVRGRWKRIGPACEAKRVRACRWTYTPNSRTVQWSNVHRIFKGYSP